MKIPSIKAVPVSKRYTFLYLEYGHLEMDGHALVFRQGDELLHLPVGNTAVLMLGPGTVVTHKAVGICAEEKTLLLWCGEQGVRLYGAALPYYGDTYNIQRQVSYAYDPVRRIEVAKRLYRRMFDMEPPQRRSVEQLRGWEGQQVKKLYVSMAHTYEVPWKGRQISTKVKRLDLVNEALEVANSCLYALAEAVIVALGYLPSIGFIHRSNERSLVFDLADTVKMPFVEAVVFAKYHEIKDPSSDVRYLCRNYFKEEQLAKRLVTILEEAVAL